MTLGRSRHCDHVKGITNQTPLSSQAELFEFRQKLRIAYIQVVNVQEIDHRLEEQITPLKKTTPMILAFRFLFKILNQHDEENS